VSLPAGVFNPYAGVKTSILLMDKTKAKQNDSILFVKVENDGFDLGAQRRPIDKNDLHEALKILQCGDADDSDLSHWVEKSKIEESGDWNLSGERYKKSDEIHTDWDLVELSEILEYEQPTKYIVESTNYNDSFKTPVLTAGKSFLLGYSDETEGIFDSEKLPVIIFDDFTTATKFVNFPFKVKSSAMKILLTNREKAIPEFIYHTIQTIDFPVNEHKRYWISQFSKLQIPLPPLSVQEEIVGEIDGYQKIIDGARQVVDNYKPTIKIDPDWEMVKLGEVCKIKSGGTPSRKVDDYWNGDIPWVGSTVCKDKKVGEAKEYITELGLNKSAAKIFKINTTLIALVGATIGKTGLLTIESTTNQNIAGLNPIDEQTLHPIYLYYATQTLYSEFMRLGSGKFRMANLSFIRQLQIPFPPLSVQQEIVGQIEAEQELVNANKKLIEIYEQKIKDKIGEVWGE